VSGGIICIVDLIRDRIRCPILGATLFFSSLVSKNGDLQHGQESLLSRMSHGKMHDLWKICEQGEVLDAAMHTMSPVS